MFNAKRPSKKKLDVYTVLYWSANEFVNPFSYLGIQLSSSFSNFSQHVLQRCNDA